jgi:small subunit ribosomal protein S20
MPQHKSNIKRLKQADAARTRNRFYKGTLATELKKLRTETSLETAKKQLTVVYSTLDKMVKKGIIHQNKANNQKSKMCKIVKALEVKA